MENNTAFTSIKNGWLNTPFNSIKTVENEVLRLIKNRQPLGQIEIFHANQVCEFLNKTLSTTCKFKVLNNKVYGLISIKILLPYSEMDESDYQQLYNKLNLKQIQ